MEFKAQLFVRITNEKLFNWKTDLKNCYSDVTNRYEKLKKI